MIIKCPECQKEISDQSDKCINCGFPLKKTPQNKICTVNGKQYNFSTILDAITINEAMGTVIRSIGDICDMSLSDAKKLFETINLNKEIPATFSIEVMPLTQPSNTPKCPTCSSTNITKISLTSKAVGGAMFGIFSSKIRNTFECKNCGYKW